MNGLVHGLFIDFPGNRINVMSCLKIFTIPMHIKKDKNLNMERLIGGRN